MKLIYIIFAVLFLFACNKNKFEVKNISLPTGGNQVVIASNAFGINTFSEILKNTANDENIMFSPLSLHLALSMAINGAQNQTSTEMKNTMQLQNLTLQQINDCYKTLIEQLVSVDKKVTFTIANSMWYDLNFVVKSDFQTNLQNYYFAQVQGLNFSSVYAAKTVNDWVNDKTNGKIDKIVDSFNPDEVLELINALYFDGKWHYRFETSKTTDEDFHLADSTIVKVPTMQQKQVFKMENTEKFTAVELPYGQGNFVIDLFLPTEGYTVTDVADSLKNFENIVKDLTDVELTIHLPKFEYKSTFGLNDLLTSMGMPTAFSDSADFGNISTEPIKITQVLQKTYIKLDEQGTQAAAVTSITFGMTSAPCEPVEIYFNKPFVYAIREVSTNTILFVGKIANPLNN